MGWTWRTTSRCRHAAAEVRKQLRQEFGKRFEALRGVA
jgi:hypothetical protein